MSRNQYLAAFSRPGSAGSAKALFTFLFAAFLFSPLATEAAPLPLVKKSFSLTFPDGWIDVGFGLSSDSTFGVVNGDLGEDVVALGFGNSYGSQLEAETIVNAQTMALTSEYARTDSSKKILGGNTFISSGYKDMSEDGDTTMRARVYVTTKGSFIFFVMTSYNMEVADEAVEQVEAALATLQIDASASLRRVTRIPAAGESKGGMDLLGRSRSPGQAGMARVPLYRLH